MSKIVTLNTAKSSFIVSDNTSNNSYPTATCSANLTTDAGYTTLRLNHLDRTVATLTNNPFSPDFGSTFYGLTSPTAAFNATADAIGSVSTSSSGGGGTTPSIPEPPIFGTAGLQATTTPVVILTPSARGIVVANKGYQDVTILVTTTLSPVQSLKFIAGTVVGVKLDDSQGLISSLSISTATGSSPVVINYNN